LINVIIEIEQLQRLVEEHGSVFVFGCRGDWFWRRGVNVYPFPPEGVLVIRDMEDERRYPGAFLTATAPGTFTVHPDLPGKWAPVFRDRWLFHLAGIVEYAPVPLTLPPWAFPPDCR